MFLIGFQININGFTITEVCFASFLSGGFITGIVVNPPERQLAKRTSVKWAKLGLLIFNPGLPHIEETGKQERLESESS